MIISVASGKGGTGKTTIAVSLALSINEDIQFLDCDAEEPNAHIFLKPAIKKCEKVFIPVPEVDTSRCNLCGRCARVCAYNAIAVLPEKVLTFPDLCHGCGACAYICPQGAIKEINREIGVTESGISGNINFVHGRLNIGQAMSPPVIRSIKKNIVPDKTVIIDAPPGTSCPVVTSLKKSDFCILVTEPTPFGLNDFILALEVVRKMKIPFGVVINRADLGDKKTEEHCKKEGIPVLMRIPFTKEIAVAYSKGEPIIKALPEYRKKFERLFDKIKHESLVKDF